MDRKILDLYEKFETFPANLQVKDGAWFDFAAPSSIHSDITSWGYGEILSRRCVNAAALGQVKAMVQVPDTDGRFYLKLTCCLRLWEKEVNDLRIAVNGVTVYEREKEFVENVNLGWPGLYYEIPGDVLHPGENEITFSTADSTGAGLLISEAKLLKLPCLEPYTQISWQKAAKKGDAYGVALYCPEGSFRGLAHTENCALAGAEYFPGNICVLSLISDTEGDAAAEAVFDSASVALELPRICENQDFCLVGFDSDDHRHDPVEEADRIPQIFAFSGLGNYFLFRPQRGRNFHDLMSKDQAERIVRLLKCFGTRFGITDYSLEMPYLQEMMGKNYFCTNVHEPYLWFNSGLEEVGNFKKIYLHDKKAMAACETFGQSEALYRDVLRRRRENLDMGSTFSVGAPSLLSVYEIDAGFDMVAVEPVSNMHLLAGSIRKSPVWGAHVPTDWYFGAPNNACKSRKFRLAMQYFYLEGASYIYAENAIFKTNAFSREDWESDFCTRNRQYLRDFYAYTVENPRIGKQIVDKAILYGNHENFFWQLHDRMAELNADGDWDSLLWGKWEDHHRKCWKAAEAWLPIAADQSEPYRTPVNKKLFSGTPYGNVDIISSASDWSEYKTLALLGWNTMTPELLEKMKNYVRDGGSLVISWCHFNMTDRNDREMTFPEAECVRDFLGLEIGETFQPEGAVGNVTADEPVTAVSCQTATAQTLVRDGRGRGIIYKNHYGKGNVWFCAFRDYFTADWAVETVQELMRSIGEEGDVRCSNPNVFFTRRALSDGREQVDLLNMSCAREGNTIDAVLHLKGREYSCSVTEGVITTMIVEAE